MFPSHATCGSRNSIATLTHFNCHGRAGLPRMKLNYFLPSPQHCSLLTMHAVVDGVSEGFSALLPAMLPNLHIRLAGSSWYVFANGERVGAPAVALIGPTNAAYQIELSAGARMVALGFLPLGWLKLVQCPAHELADGIIDGADLWGEKACATLIEQLSEATLDGSHVSLIERFLSAVERQRRHVGLVAAADHWLEHSPDLAVDALSEALDVGRRHLQRLMPEVYGAPPKSIAMKYRALRTATWMATQRPQTVAAAVAHYADQSHLNRDFKRFIGMSPSMFLKDQASVTAGTLLGRYKAGARRALSLWS